MLFSHRYPEAIASPDELRVMDAFVVRYDAREQASLPMHIDENTFSFTIALNDRSEYEGGGTMFAQVRPLGAEDEPFGPTVLNADAGGVVTFPGKLLHGGNVVTKGMAHAHVKRMMKTSPPMCGVRHRPTIHHTSLYLSRCERLWEEAWVSAALHGV